MKLNYLDVDNDKYKDLLACILRYMEPKFLEPNSFVCRQNQQFDEILFIMNGDLEIGYNNIYFLAKNGIKANLNASSIKEKILGLVDKTGDQTGVQDLLTKLRKKFHYPI